MKNILLMLCLVLTSNVYAHNEIDSTFTPVSMDCTVYLTAIQCVGDELECYTVTWSGGSEKFKVFIKSSVYGISEQGYRVFYTKPMESGTYIIHKTFRTKGECLAAFVDEAIGKCTYTFK